MEKIIFQKDTLSDITSSKSPLRIELSEKLFSYLSEVMNDIHDTTFSERFWTLLLRSHVNAVISRKPLLEQKEHNRKPDLYPVNGYSFPGRKQKIKQTVIRTAKWALSILNERTLFQTVKNNESLLLGFPTSEALNREELGVALPYFQPFFCTPGNKSKRQKVNDLAGDTEDIFLKNVIKELPKILVEHFRNLYNRIPVSEPKKKTFHIHLPGTVLTEYLVAKYLEKGAKLIWYQHGSEYGEFTNDYAHYFEHKLSDRFRTWGWKIREYDEPWTAYRLEAFREEYTGYNKEAAYKVLICYPDLNNKRREEHKLLSHQLFSELDDEKYPKILSRPRRSNKLHSHASELSFIRDERVEVSSGLRPMMKEMSECELVLQVNVPCTNFLECLFVDHPTVGILRNDQPTDIVKPYYEFFQKEGVLHTDMKSLVEHLNRINIREWWDELMHREEYRNYKQTFARSPE